MPGAGIQADLKTFAALGVYGTSVLTAVTAQNTEGVADIDVLSAEMVAAQIDQIAMDLEIAAVKTGMLATADIILTVCATRRRPLAPESRRRPSDAGEPRHAHPSCARGRLNTEDAPHPGRDRRDPQCG